MRVETNVRVSAFDLQMAQNPEDIINYAKQMNNQKVCEKIVELLKDLGYGEGVDIFEGMDRWYA